MGSVTIWIQQTMRTWRPIHVFLNSKKIIFRRYGSPIALDSPLWRIQRWQQTWDGDAWSDQHKWWSLVPFWPSLADEVFLSFSKIPPPPLFIVFNSIFLDGNNCSTQAVLLISMTQLLSISSTCPALPILFPFTMSWMKQKNSKLHPVAGLIPAGSPLSSGNFFSLPNPFLFRFIQLLWF